MNKRKSRIKIEVIVEGMTEENYLKEFTKDRDRFDEILRFNFHNVKGGSYYEWSKHEKELKTEKSVDMDIIDFFSDDPIDSPFNIISKEQVELNKKWFIGDFE